MAQLVDLALSLLRLWSLLWPWFDPWQRNLHMSMVRPKRKKRKEKRTPTLEMLAEEGFS